MDDRTAEILDRATRGFYETCASSFSESRQEPWPGWERLLRHVPHEGHMSVLDVGCGNMRFERFLAGGLPGCDLSFYAVDRCVELAQDAPGDVEFIEADVGADAESALTEIPDCDLCVSFALLHHLPKPESREMLLRALLAKVSPGGVACVSFWQFAKSRKLMEKSLYATERGCRELGVVLDAGIGDFLLGWQGREGVYRYCHSFGDAEVVEMCEKAARATGCRIIDEYSADGRTGDLNRYVVFRRM